MVTIDVVGGVQALAELWVRSDEELREASRRVVEAKAEHERAQRQLEDAATKLMDRVGRTIPTKVFQIGPSVVIVDHERGIQRVSIEKL